MAIHRITLRWTGFLGAPGYTAFHFHAGGGLISDAQSSVERVEAAILNLTTVIPGAVDLQVEPEVEVIDEDSGLITDFINAEVSPAISGTASGPFSAASGAVVNWRTNDLRFGRRIRGRTFIVPCVAAAYEADGTLSSGALGALNSFAEEMTSIDFDSSFVVWSRPRNGSGGVAATVIGHTVPDMAAVLRSRRD